MFCGGEAFFKSWEVDVVSKTDKIVWFLVGELSPLRARQEDL